MARAAILLAIFSFGLIIAIPSYAEPPNGKDQDAKRTALWEALKKTKHEATEKIETYGENPSLTEICFYADGKVWFFVKTEGKVRQLTFQVMLGRINRITFEESPDFFVLWANGKRAMQFGSSK